MPSFSGLFARGFLLAAGIFAAGLVSHLPASSVSGVVLARQGDRLAPVVRASVAAREAAGSDILAVARTDGEGRFLIVGLSSPRVALSVRKPGYYTRLVNGRENRTIVLDCSAPADCAGVEFELGHTASISGIVVDELGEPFEMGVRISRANDGGSERAEAGSERSDDRGYFRLSGLEPGEYTVEAERMRRGFPRGLSVESDAIDVEVEEGAEVSGLQLTVRFSESQQPRYRVSGRVAGVDLSSEGAHLVQMRSVPGAGGRVSGASMSTRAQGDGSFEFAGLSEGRYSLSYVYRGNSSQNREGERHSLGTVEVSGDVSGLLVRPLPPTGFSGVMRFETSGGPRPVQFVLTSDDGAYFAWEHVEAPDFRFDVRGLSPGSYRLAIRNNWRASSEVYVKGIVRGEEFSPTAEVLATEGLLDTFDIVVSDETARVYGRIKAAAEPGAERAIVKGSQFQVALSAEDQRTRVAQADQHGRFHFDGIIPGEYRICGWADVEPRVIYNEETWEQAGSAVRRFTVEAGSNVELELTAAQ
jgi:hypothetical protein